MIYKDIGVIIPFYSLGNKFDQDVALLQNTVSCLVKYSNKIIVVDDGTELSNIEVAKLIKHNCNLGKGASIRTGLSELLKDKSIEFVIECDSDNDQDPNEVIRFINRVDEMPSDSNIILIGDRYSAPQMRNPSKYRESLNEIQTQLFSQFNFSIHDSVSGFRGYSRGLAEEIFYESKSNGFGIATEELIIAYLKNSSVEEIHLNYAKPRKSFTRSYKLSEVIEGILNHSTELENRGHKDLIDFLFNIKSKIDSREKIIVVDMKFIHGKKYTFFRQGGAYTMF